MFRRIVIMSPDRSVLRVHSLLLGGFLSLAAVPAPEARAQAVSIEPAETIRVVERVDQHGRRVEREVVDRLLPAEILAVQVALADAGFELGAMTGALDPATRGALRRFQIDRGLSICGCVSYETVVALGIVPRVVADVPSYARRGHESVIVIVPDGHRRHHRRSGAAVVVGAGGRSGVFVGHAPAVGAGRVGHRPPRPIPDGRIGRPLPAPPRPGGLIRAGGPDGFQGRPPAERPRRPAPR